MSLFTIGKYKPPRQQRKELWENNCRNCKKKRVTCNRCDVMKQLKYIYTKENSSKKSIEFGLKATVNCNNRKK